MNQVMSKEASSPAFLDRITPLSCCQRQLTAQMILGAPLI